MKRWGRGRSEKNGESMREQRKRVKIGNERQREK